MLQWDIRTCLCCLTILQGSLLPAAHAVVCRTHKRTPHSLPPERCAVVSVPQVHSAILRWITGDTSASIAATSHPLPVLPHEQDMRITEAAGEGTSSWGQPGWASQRLQRAADGSSWESSRAAANCRHAVPSGTMHLHAVAARVAPVSRCHTRLAPAGELLLVMCLVLAAAVLSASFAVFLVRWAPQPAQAGTRTRRCCTRLGGQQAYVHEQPGTLPLCVLPPPQCQCNR